MSFFPSPDCKGEGFSYHRKDADPQGSNFENNASRKPTITVKPPNKDPKPANGANYF